MSLPRFLDGSSMRRFRFSAGSTGPRSGRSSRRSRSRSPPASEQAEGAGRAGFLLAANLAARLYPRIVLAGPANLVRLAEDEIRLVNPQADVAVESDEPTTATLGYETAVAGPNGVAVAARGWNVHVDEDVDDDEAAPAAALLAAAMGVGELFRVVFADELGAHGRSGSRPAAFNLVTLAEPLGGLPLAADVDVGEFRLVGAGAIGQAAAHTLAVAGARGSIVAVDPEKVALSNLQRYVLTTDADVGAVKVDLLRDASRRRPRGRPGAVGVARRPGRGSAADARRPRLRRGAPRRPVEPAGADLQRLDAAGRRRLVQA